jgi:GNAT superfamily N-acetyltransferase
VALELAELMPADSSEIRAILNRDPFWCLYALGDLDPHEYPLCDWRVKVGMQPAVVLLYQRFTVPVLFAVGQPADVEAVPDSRPLPPKVYLHVRPDITSIVRADYELVATYPMVRMIFRGRINGKANNVRRLTELDIPSLIKLYAERRAGLDGGVFFDPIMVHRGCYYGVWEGGHLIAAAGTHLVNELAGVAGVGNVFCHSSHRGKGMGRAVFIAVVKELSDRGIPTIGLNVSPSNEAARGLYQSLGFVDYCTYEEGLASRPMPRER